MQITIDFKDENIAKNVLWFLETLKDKGVSIIKSKKDNDSSNFKYKKLDPMENYYTLFIDTNNEEMSNPFKDVENSVLFAKKLREESYR